MVDRKRQICGVLFAIGAALAGFVAAVLLAPCLYLPMAWGASKFYPLYVYETPVAFLLFVSEILLLIVLPRYLASRRFPAITKIRSYLFYVLGVLIGATLVTLASFIRTLS